MHALDRGTREEEAENDGTQEADDNWCFNILLNFWNVITGHISYPISLLACLLYKSDAFFCVIEGHIVSPDIENEAEVITDLKPAFYLGSQDTDDNFCDEGFREDKKIYINKQTQTDHEVILDGCLPHYHCKLPETPARSQSECLSIMNSDVSISFFCFCHFRGNISTCLSLMGSVTSTLAANHGSGISTPASQVIWKKSLSQFTSKWA